MMKPKNSECILFWDISVLYTSIHVYKSIRLSIYPRSTLYSARHHHHHNNNNKRFSSSSTSSSSSSSLKNIFAFSSAVAAGSLFMVVNAAAEEDKFETWADEISQRSDVIQEVDVYSRVKKQQIPGRAVKNEPVSESRSLIWYTLQGKGKIERFKMWKVKSDDSQVSQDATSIIRPGVSRSLSLVRLGDQVCGHKEFIHGGMTAALIDDLFGWQTGMERAHLLAENEKMYRNAKAFTARLNVNYRRPIPKQDVFLVECKVSRVEKHKKVWLETKIFDREGNILADGEALYIITNINK